MKKILGLAALVALFAFSCSVSKIQQTSRASDDVRYVFNKYTGKMDAVLSNKSVTITIDSGNVNSGDSIIFIPAPSTGALIIDKIVINKGSGNAYTIAAGDAADTVSWVYTYSADTARKLFYISNQSLTSGPDQIVLAKTYSIDIGSPVWIDFSDRLQVGTKPLNFSSYLNSASGSVTLVNGASNAAIGDSIANMKAGVFNVLDYGAVADTAINSTVAIQACFDAAKDGTVLINGLFRVDSVHIEYNPKIVGVGGYSYDQTSTSGFYSRTNHCIINFAYGKGDGWAYGGRMTDIIILGKTTLANQDGIKISGESDLSLERVYIASCGKNGVYFDPTVHTTGVKIINCRIENNHGDGIFGMGQSTAQLNAIDISHCSVQGNTGNGISIFGYNITINRNTIQANTGKGIFISARLLGEVSTTSQNINITNNYIEQNVAGNIIAESYILNAKYQYVLGLSISNNYMYLTDAVSSANANIVLRAATNATFHEMFKNLKIGENTYGGDLYDVSGVVGASVGWSYISTSAIVYMVNAASLYNGLETPDGGPNFINTLKVDVSGNARTSGAINYVLDNSGSSNDTYTATVMGTFTFTTGKVITFHPLTLNTGACTLSINSGTAYAIKTQANADPANSDMVATGFYNLCWNGTNWVLMK